MHKGEALFLQGVLARLAEVEVDTIYIQRCEANELQRSRVAVTIGVRSAGDTKETTVQFSVALVSLEHLRVDPASHGWRRTDEALAKLGVS